jgi:hypothetical protein
MTRVLNRRYLVVGSSDSFAPGGLRNWWALILGESGEVVQSLSLGGSDAEDPHTAIATSDGGFMIGGGSASFGTVFSDIWLVKFDSRAQIEWQKVYGMSSRTDHAWHIEETTEGYSIIGDSYSYPVEYDVWLMTIDKSGGIAEGQCGSAMDTDAIPSQARVVVEPIEMTVTAVPQPFQIASCSPE